MQKQGWSHGTGLGAEKNQGRLVPVALDLEDSALKPFSKSGLGYTGEKLERKNLKRVAPKRHITTIYDQKDDSEDGLLRRNELTYNKRRWIESLTYCFVKNVNKFLPQKQFWFIAVSVGVCATLSIFRANYFKKLSNFFFSVKIVLNMTYQFLIFRCLGLQFIDLLNNEWWLWQWCKQIFYL